MIMARFVVLAVVSVKTTVFLDVTHRIVLYIYPRFEGNYSLHLQGGEITYESQPLCGLNVYHLPRIKDCNHVFERHLRYGYM